MSLAMMDLIAKYRTVLTQGFMPICVGDRFQIELLAECVLASGASAIEITCRRPDARAEIARVKKSFPQLIVLAGSVVDDGPLLTHLQRRQPLLPSLKMLADAGADGFVSALPIRPASVNSWSKTHLVIPGVETPAEIVVALESGAQLAKLFTADLMGGSSRVARLCSPPTHGLLPLFVTGGILQNKVDEYLTAGAVMLGSGWDVILGDRYRTLQDLPNPSEMAEALRSFLRSFESSRARLSPEWGSLPKQPDRAFLQSRKHYVPTAWLESKAL